MIRPASWRPLSTSDTFSTCIFSDSQSACNSGHISPAVGPSVKVSVARKLRALISTNLIVEECIPDVFHQSRHSNNIVLTFLVSLGDHTTVDRVPVVPNLTEGAWKKLAGLQGEGDSRYPLKQLLPKLVLILIMERVVIVLRAQPSEPSYNGLQLILRHRGHLFQRQ